MAPGAVAAGPHGMLSAMTDTAHPLASLSPDDTVRTHGVRGHAASAGPACSGHQRTVTRRWPSSGGWRTPGVNHIDTAEYYGPDVANELIRRR